MVVEGWPFLNLNAPTHELLDVLHIPNERRVLRTNPLGLGAVLGVDNARSWVDEVEVRREANIVRLVGYGLKNILPVRM